MELLVAFDAVVADGQRFRVTPLGRWARSAISERNRTAFGAAPAGEFIAPDRICQLKIGLKDVRPPCWRRVLVPATTSLGVLHAIIQVVMDWDGDQLHSFSVGKRYYGDPRYVDVDDDEDTLTVGRAFTANRATIGYTYDFGDDWRHEIVLEKTLDRQEGSVYPVCVAGRGSSRRAGLSNWE